MSLGDSAAGGRVGGGGSGGGLVSESAKQHKKRRKDNGGVSVMFDTEVEWWQTDKVRLYLMPIKPHAHQ